MMYGEKSIWYNKANILYIFNIVSNIITGNFEEAKRYFFESLRRRELTQGKDHHGVGATKNNIGLMFDLMGDHEQALKYYTEGE